MKRSLPLGALIALLLPIILGWMVDRQGLDLIEDGRWLLATERIGELHSELRSNDAPARILLLWVSSKVVGLGAHALVLLRALMAGLLSLSLWAALGRVEMGRLRWLAPACVVAMGSPPPEIALIGGALWALLARSRMFWPLSAIAALFGPAAWATVLALGTLRGVGRSFLLSHSTGLVLLLLAGVGFGAPGAMLAQTLVEPFSIGVDQLRGGSAGGWWRSLAAGPFLRTPYAGLGTGEAPGLQLPAHGTLRLAASWLLYLFVLGTPIWLLLRKRQLREQLPWLIVALFALSKLLLRGDWLQLQQCLLCGAALAPIVASRGRARQVLALLFVLALLPTTFERLVLATTQSRETLVLWEEPRARVLIGSTRMQRLSALAHELTHDEGPLFVWPPTGGLNFLSHRPPATTALLPRPGQDRLIEDIRRSQPTSVLLAPSVFRGASALAATEPKLLNHLRRNYRLLGSISGGFDEYRALELLEDPDELPQMRLPQRLPMAEMTVGNDSSPPLRPGFTIGQSVRMGDSDLNGLSLRWRVEKPELYLKLRVRFWMKRLDKYDVLIDYFDTDLLIPQDGYRSYLRFGPVERTAGLDLAMTIELLEDAGAEVRLMMHRHDGAGKETDLFQLGSALFNEEAVDADLVFAVY